VTTEKKWDGVDSFKRYRVNEIFYSLQGEGARAGEASVFVRFSGCNLACKVETHGFDCDTEFVSGQGFSKRELFDACVASTKSAGCRWVVFTGGEPLLQLDDELIDWFKTAGVRVAIETNGSLPLGELVDRIDWIVCSPKVAEHAVKLEKAHELRYVRRKGMGIPKPSLVEGVTHRYISPGFDTDGLGREDLGWCIGLCKAHPEWRLSVQQHKLWSIR
jgi:7-carboxy-7-deazaguanine synthase